jgi:predicted DNA-binding protein YlxM (UPF0122 family)
MPPKAAAQSTPAPKTILRKAPKPLTDAEKFQILSEYSSGVSIDALAERFNVSDTAVKNLINTTKNSLAAVQETNRLITTSSKPTYLPFVKPAQEKFLNQDFLEALEEKAEVYAYFFAHTGDNKFALAQAGLDKGIGTPMPLTTQDYIRRIRGEYIRNIPDIKAYIREIQDKKIEEFRIGKPELQMELVGQIEQLKEVVSYEPRQRGNLLKAIELLGRTIGAFVDRLEVEEVDAKSGLQILMERAKREASNGKEITKGSYTVEDC